MKQINLPGKTVPLIDAYDVVVVGGGTAGSVAAISSAREGARTLVVEQFGALGGSQTMGLVTPMMHNHIEGNPFSSAIDEEICNRMIEWGYGLEAFGGNKGWFDPQMLKIVLEAMVVESGCDILYHTVLTDVLVNESKIKAIVVHNKNGTSAIQAKRLIDCTGDADVAFLAGLPMESGDKGGYNQAISLRFQMTNIDLEKFGKYLEFIGQKGVTRYPVLHAASVRGKEWPLDGLFEEKYREGLLIEQDLKYFQVFSVPGKPKDLAFNCPELGGQRNVIEAEYLSQKQVEGKQAILRISKFLKQCVPGFEEAYITDIASMMGIRESRRIVGEYRLTKEDVFNYAKFPDGIARTNYPLDVHGGSEEVLQYVDKDITEQYYEIPYQSLVPVGVDNLLVAGRCISADFLAQSTLRIQPTCRAMGEAAGIAANLSIKQDIPCKEVAGKQVRTRMRERGAWL